MDFKWINSAPSISRLDLLQQVFICLGLSLVIQFITHSAQLARLIKYKTRILHFLLEMYIRLSYIYPKRLNLKVGYTLIHFNKEKGKRLSCIFHQVAVHQVRQVKEELVLKRF